MKKKITINGVKVNSIETLQNEILEKLRVDKPKTEPFVVKMKRFLEHNKIDELIINWTFFSISLLKMSVNKYGQKTENFDMQYESSMHFHSFNDILISEEDFKNKVKREEIIKKDILNCFSNIENVKIIFEG